MSPEATALVLSETRIAEVLAATEFRWEDRSKIPALVNEPRNSQGLDAAYYQNLHDHNEAYQSNNWLVDHAEAIASRAHGGTVLEIGSGNCLFAKKIAGRVTRVYATDWMRPVNLEIADANVLFSIANVLTDELPIADIVCSADVLEHLPPEKLEDAIERLTHKSKNQYHVIACYDDTHSHLTVMSPGVWLWLFRKYVSDAKILDIECRRDDPNQIVCTIIAGN